MTRATAPGLSDLAAEAPQSTPVADLRDMVNSGGPDSCAWSASSGATR